MNPMAIFCIEQFHWPVVGSFHQSNDSNLLLQNVESEIVMCIEQYYCFDWQLSSLSIHPSQALK